MITTGSCHIILVQMRHVRNAEIELKSISVDAGMFSGFPLLDPGSLSFAIFISYFAVSTI